MIQQLWSSCGNSKKNFEGCQFDPMELYLRVDRRPTLGVLPAAPAT